MAAGRPAISIDARTARVPGLGQNEQIRTGMQQRPPNGPGPFGDVRNEVSLFLTNPCPAWRFFVRQQARRVAAQARPP